jgi:hypothetical protein
MKMDGSGSDSSEDLIGYKALHDSAMKTVMRDALKTAVDQGALPGGHHFYITFKTAGAGVSLADAIKDRFPDEMTIVIQNQYWDLEVTDERFEVVLKFGGMPQHLVVPFSAVVRFYDPSVNFGLVFETDQAQRVSSEIETPVEKDSTSDEKSEEEGTVVSLDAFRRK